MTPDDLKYSILKLAFSGKLVPQISSEKIVDKHSFKLEDAPFDVPESWNWNYLGKCAEIYTGNSISESVKKAKYLNKKDGLDYIGTKDVEFNHSINYNNGVRIPENDNFKHAVAGSILLCIEGGSAGRKIAIADRTICFGNKLCNFTALTIDNKFLYFYLQSSFFKRVFSDNISGIIGGVSINKLKNILLPIPPLEEQKRIASRIEELLPLLDKYEDAWNDISLFNSKFPSDIKKSILQYAVQGKLVKRIQEEGTGARYLNEIISEHSKLLKNKKIKNLKYKKEINDEEIPFSIPSHWAWARLAQVCTKIVDGDHNPPAGINASTSFLMLSAINIADSGIVELSRLRFLTKEQYEEENLRTQTKEGDILFTIVGTLGRSCIYDGKLNVCFQRSVSVITTSIFNKYLKYVFDSPYIQNFMIKNATGTAQKGFYLNQVNDLLIPIPPLEEQKRIVNKIEEVLLKINSIKGDIKNG